MSTFHNSKPNKVIRNLSKRSSDLTLGFIYTFTTTAGRLYLSMYSALLFVYRSQANESLSTDDYCAQFNMLHLESNIQSMTFSILGLSVIIAAADLIAAMRIRHTYTGSAVAKFLLFVQDPVSHPDTFTVLCL